MTTVRLAIGGSHKGMTATLSKCAGDLVPAILVSYVYLHTLRNHGATWNYRDWVLDSGAYSAFKSGELISLQKYIDTCKEVLDSENPPAEIYALDVIGDWRKSRDNCKAMWEQGIEAIPCYHAGEPEDVLTGLAADHPKIALGGIALIGRGHAHKGWLEQCFARVWPKKVHGFAQTSRQWLEAVPWHSTDSTSWQIGPMRYGLWTSYGNKHLRIRGGKVDMRNEVAHYLKLESEAKRRWAKQMKELDDG